MPKNESIRIQQDWALEDFYVHMQFKEALGAAFRGDLEAFRRSIRELPVKYIDGLPVDSAGRNMVHYAALCGGAEFTDLLEEKGCALDGALNHIVDTWRTVKDVRGKYFPNGVEATVGDPTHTIECLREALRESKKSLDRAIAIVSLLPANAIDVAMDDGKTLLHHACAQAADADFLKYLIGRGASLDAKDKDGNTPLHSAACATGKRAGENIKVLLDICNPAQQNAQNVYGYTPLDSAVSARNSSTMFELVNDYTDINITCAAHQNVMHIAARKLSNTELEKFFDKVKGVLNARETLDRYGIARYSEALFARDGADETSGISPIGYAAKRHLKCTEEMLRDCLEIGDRTHVGSKQAETDLLTKSVNVIGESILHLAVRDTSKSLGDTFSKYVVEEAFVRGGEDVFNVRDKAGNTPVHTAAMYGSSAIFRKVVEFAPASAVSTNSELRVTPIEYLVSASSSNGAALEKLGILTGSDKCASIINKMAIEGGDVPIVQAYKKKNSAAVKVLLASPHLDIEATSRDGLNVIHHAARAGDTTALKEFLAKREMENGKSGTMFTLNNPGDITPGVHAIRAAKNDKRALRAIKVLANTEPDHGMLLIEAARNGRGSVIDYVTKRYGISVDSVLVTRDGKQTTLLAEALGSGHFSLAKRLIEKKHASVSQVADRDPLITIAVEGGCFDGIFGSRRLKYMVRKGAGLGADVSVGETAPLISIMNRFITRGHDPKLHEQGLSLLKTMTSLGADPNAMDTQGNTAAHLAVRGHDRYALSHLAKKGADLTVADARGDTPLHLSVIGGNYRMFKRIIRHNPETLVHANGMHFASVLHTAAKSPNISDKELLRMLKKARSYLKFEAFKSLINAQDQHGTTLLHIVAEKGNVDVCEYLMKKHVQFSVVDSNGKTPCDLVPENSPLRKKDMLSRRSLFKEMQRRTVTPKGGFMPFTLPEVELTEGNTVVLHEGKISKRAVPHKSTTSLLTSRTGSVSSISTNSSVDTVSISTASYGSDAIDYSYQVDSDFDDISQEEETYLAPDLSEEEPIYENVGRKRAEALASGYEGDSSSQEEEIYSTIDDEEGIYSTIDDDEIYSTVSGEGVYSTAGDSHASSSTDELSSIEYSSDSVGSNVEEPIYDVPSHSEESYVSSEESIYANVGLERSEPSDVERSANAERVYSVVKKSGPAKPPRSPIEEDSYSANKSGPAKPPRVAIEEDPYSVVADNIDRSQEEHVYNTVADTVDPEERAQIDQAGPGEHIYLTVKGDKEEDVEPEYHTATIIPKGQKEAIEAGKARGDGIVYADVVIDSSAARPAVNRSSEDKTVYADIKPADAATKSAEVTESAPSSKKKKSASSTKKSDDTKKEKSSKVRKKSSARKSSPSRYGDAESTPSTKVDSFMSQLQGSLNSRKPLRKVEEILKNGNATVPSRRSGSPFEKLMSSVPYMERLSKSSPDVSSISSSSSEYELSSDDELLNASWDEDEQLSRSESKPSKNDISPMSDEELLGAAAQGLQGVSCDEVSASDVSNDAQEADLDNSKGTEEGVDSIAEAVLNSRKSGYSR